MKKNNLWPVFLDKDKLSHPPYGSLYGAHLNASINPIDPSKPVQLIPVAIVDFSQKFEPYQPGNTHIRDAVVKLYDQALEGKHDIITNVLTRLLGHAPTAEEWKELHLHLVSENFTQEKTSVKAEFYFQGILLGMITSYIDTGAGKAGVIFTPAPPYDGKVGS